MNITAQILTTINSDQMQALLRHMNQTDWYGISAQIFAQFVGVAIAAYSGFYFQKVFKRADDKKSKIQAAYGFNEAIAFVGILIENSVTRLEGLIIPTLFSERGIYAKIESKAKNQAAAPTRLDASFQSIWPMDIPTAGDVLNKVPNIGKHIHLALAFNRMRHSMIQSVQICNERNLLIQQFISMPKDDPVIVMLRCGEILDRTQKMVMNEEAILDAAMYISEGLIPVGEELKLELKEFSDEKFFIAKMTSNEFYNAVLKKANELVDINPEMAGRFLHMRHKDIADAVIDNPKA